VRAEAGPRAVHVRVRQQGRGHLFLDGSSEGGVGERDAVHGRFDLLERIRTVRYGHHTYDSGAATEYCGQACIAWACVVKGYGWNVARLV
jgi:hypothetical protein